MAIDLRDVKPLGSKSEMMAAAMRQQRANQPNGGSIFDNIDMSDMISPDFAWLNEDRTALEGLVAQMDASIGQLASQMKEMESQTRKNRASIDKEQQLLFKQIQTMNILLKKQLGLFSALEGEVAEIEMKQNNLIPQIGVGIIAGLMSAVTILVTAPWMTVLMDNLR